jgi:NAD(P) transhydrogenase
MRARFDLAVIGSGPAGQKAAISAAKLDKRVAIVEARACIGGVCTHTGTIPSKAIREAVLHLTGFRMRSVYGASYQVKRDVSMSDLIFRVEHVIRIETDVIRAQLQRNNVTCIYGPASFVDPHTLQIETPEGEDRITADYIVIASGTMPARPPDVPFDGERIIDSDGLIRMAKLPRSMLIVGGGVIGTEYACMLALLGVRVTLVDGRPRLLEFVDAEIAEALQYQMRLMGIRLRLGETVDAISKPDGHVEAVLASGKKLYAETLLYAVGRVGNTARLNLAAAGLSADDRGRLKVDEHYRTEVEHIFAAGDVIGFPSLASTSMEQGRLASFNAFGGDVISDRKLLPYGIYAIPEVSMVGPNEQELTKNLVPYEVGIARYREIARGQLIGDESGMLKLLFHQQTRKLLGVHIIGEGATELVHIGQAIMACEADIDYFVNTVFNYPTLAECYKVAALDGINRMLSAGAAAPKRRLADVNGSKRDLPPVPISVEATAVVAEAAAVAGKRL